MTNLDHGGGENPPNLCLDNKCFKSPTKRKWLLLVGQCQWLATPWTHLNRSCENRYSWVGTYFHATKEKSHHGVRRPPFFFLVGGGSGVRGGGGVYTSVGWVSKIPLGIIWASQSDPLRVSPLVMLWLKTSENRIKKTKTENQVRCNPLLGSGSQGLTAMKT
jgi:hypothetical protein